MSIQKINHEWLGAKSRNVEVCSKCAVTYWNYISTKVLF